MCRVSKATIAKRCSDRKAQKTKQFQKIQWLPNVFHKTSALKMFRAVYKISAEKKAFLILHAGTKKLDNFRKLICANQGQWLPLIFKC